MEEVRQQFQSHAVMAADLQRDQALMPAETLFGGEGGLQDQFRIRKELQPFLGKGDAFAGPAEQLYLQLFFQGLDLMAHCRLCDLQGLGGPGEIQVFSYGDKTF